METPSVDDLVARAIITTYGDISIIGIPDVEIFSKSIQIAALKKAELRLVSGHLDAEALQSRLQSITPPPDEQEDDEESRLLEAQARQDLEGDGCPACYPPHLDVPVRNPPKKHRPIIEYWQSFSSTGDVVLCAQRSDWRKFRASQIRVRDRYGHERFNMFVDEVRERRRRHTLDNDVHLLFDLQQQSQKQNWIEFQDYHLKYHERLRKKGDGLIKELDDAQRKAESTDSIGSEHAAQNERAIWRRLEYAERTLRWHEVILTWIERQRYTMALRSLTPVEDSYDQNPAPKAILRTSPRQHRSRRPDTFTALGKVRVSKYTPKTRSIQTQTFKAPKFKPFIVDLGVGTPSSTQEPPKRRETKRRRAKNKQLSQVVPQRVSKADRFAHTSLKPRSWTQRPVAGRTRDVARSPHRRASQPSYPAPVTVKTRSGRLSRPPVRWVKDGIYL